MICLLIFLLAAGPGTNKDAGTAIWPKNSRLVASWGFRKVLYYVTQQIALAWINRFFKI